MSFLQDLRYGLRTLAKSRGFAAVAVITLALGIGANTAIFSFVDGILLSPLPYPEPDRIVRVLERPPAGERNVISTLNFLDWQRDNEVFDYMAAQTNWTVTLTGVDEPLQLRGGQVSARYFDIFGIAAAHGRTFLPDEDQLGNANVVVLTHAFWTSQFGADPSVLDHTIQLNGEPHTVVGVLPAGSAFDRGFRQIWRPLAFEPSNMTRDFHWLVSLARLKAGVSLEQAQANMDTIAGRIEAEFPESNKGWGAVVERYGDVLIGEDARTVLLLLMTATVLVLLIGCANLANLALARGLAREREVAIRASLGAGRSRLMRQFLTENVILSVGGGILGVGLGYGLMKWLLRQVPPGAMGQEFTVTMDLRVLLFALAISLFTGVLFGLAPAFQATNPDLASTMKEGGRGASGSVARKRLRDTLIVVEVAMAFMLLVGSGLMMRSFVELLNVDTGLDSTNVLTMGLPVSNDRYPDPVRLNLYLRNVRAAVDAVPGVTETALSCAPPLQGTCYGMPMQVEGRPVVDRAERQGGFYKIVSPSYFSALGLTMLRGRALSDRDLEGTPPALVMNERLAQRYFEDTDPIGQRILIQEIVPGGTELGPDIAWEVVGVVANEKMFGLADDQSAGVYVSNEQSPVYFVNLNVRTSVDPLTLQQAITAAVHDVDRDQAVSNVRTVEQIKDQSLLDQRLQSTLFGVFAAIALLLATVGIYGVMSYSVGQRTHEFGIRTTLGEPAGSLLRLVLRRGLILTSTGLVVGLAASLGLTRFLANVLYGVGAQDPLTVGSVATILAAVAIVACYLPARRATQVDPMVALRSE